MAKNRQHVYAFEIKMGRSVAESQQQQHSTKARDIHMTLSTYKSHEFSNGLVMQSALLSGGIRGGIRTMLRIGLILTLHPSKGRAAYTYVFIDAG